MAHAGEKRQRDDGISRGTWRYPEDFVVYLWDVYSSDGKRRIDPDLLALRLCESRGEARWHEEASDATFHPVFLAAAAGDKSTMEVFLGQGYNLFPSCDRMPRKFARFCCTKSGSVTDALFVMFNCDIKIETFRWALRKAREVRPLRAVHWDRRYWWQACERPHCEHWSELHRLGFLGDGTFDPISNSGSVLVRSLHKGLSCKDPRKRAAWEEFVRMQMDYRDPDSFPCRERDDFLSVLERSDPVHQYWVNLAGDELFREVAMRNSGDFCFRAAMTTSLPLSDRQRKILMDVARAKGWVWTGTRYSGVDDFSLARLAKVDPELCRTSIESMSDFDRMFFCEDEDSVKREANFRSRCRLIGWRNRMRVVKMGLRS